jgi:hypothetical protein
MSRPPSQAVIEAVERAERDHYTRWFMSTRSPRFSGRFECVCGAPMKDGTAEAHDAHRRFEVARAAEEAALRAAAERMDDLSRGTPLAAAITARAAAKRLEHMADELTDETGEQ